jgi:hypothetical protein
MSSTPAIVVAATRNRLSRASKHARPRSIWIVLDRIADDPAPLRRRCRPTRSIFDEASTALFSDNSRRDFIKSASHKGLHVKILSLRSRQKVQLLNVARSRVSA